MHTPQIKNTLTTYTCTQEISMYPTTFKPHPWQILPQINSSLTERDSHITYFTLKGRASNQNVGKIANSRKLAPREPALLVPEPAEKPPLQSHHSHHLWPYHRSFSLLRHGTSLEAQACLGQDQHQRSSSPNQAQSPSPPVAPVSCCETLALAFSARESRVTSMILCLQ